MPFLCSDPLLGFIRSTQSAGQSVKARTVDSPTEEAIVMPNCLKNVPVVPDMNVTGMNTAMKTSVVDMQATVTSLSASLTARRMLVAPCSSFVITASTTTMALSTTVPMASTNANSVSRFSEKPASLTKTKVPIRDTMIVMDGMRVALMSCKKKNTTSTTRTMATMRVSTTLYIEA